MARSPVPLLLAIAAAASSAPAQALMIPEVAIPRLPSQAARPEAFVPTGWRIESRLDGAVDADARADVVLLLRADDARNVVDNDGLGPPRLDTNPRLLAVLRHEGPAGYRLLVQDARLIPRHENPVTSDPLEEGGLSLARRVLKVTLGSFASAGSWSMGSTTYAFRLQDGCMRLIGYDSRSVHRASGEIDEASVNLLTGRAILREGSIESDASRERRATTSRRGVVCLQEVGDGFAFDPGIVGR